MQIANTCLKRRKPGRVEQEKQNGGKWGQMLQPCFTSDVILPNIKVSLHIQREARGTDAATQLVEHARVEDSRRLLEEAQNAVGHHLSHETTTHAHFFYLNTNVSFISAGKQCVD